MVPFAPEASRALCFAVVRAGCVGEGLSLGLFHFVVSFLVCLIDSAVDLLLHF